MWGLKNVEATERPVHGIYIGPVAEMDGYRVLSLTNA
jgi:hypothetical protein